MINAQMREYDFYTYGAKDSYGLPQLSKEPQGKIKIAINVSSQSAQDNILYEDTLKDEPFKFFKSKHKDWEQRRQNLYRHICHIETNYGDELQELEKIMDQLYGKKRKATIKLPFSYGIKSFCPI